MVDAEGGDRDASASVYHTAEWNGLLESILASPVVSWTLCCSTLVLVSLVKDLVESVIPRQRLRQTSNRHYGW